MKFKKFLFSFLVGAFAMFSVTLSGVQMDSNIVHAVDLGDDLGSGSSGDYKGSGLGDFLKGHEAVTDEQMNDAAIWAKPLTDFFGNVIGVGIVVLTAGIFVVTVADLIYIGIPISRMVLAPRNTQVQGGMMGGMPMGGGYGMGGYGGRMGGYGMGGMMGAMNQQAQNTPGQWQIISDEAVQCMALIGGGAQQTPQMGIGMNMGMNMGMGMQQQQPMPTKSVIFTYFKKRVFFMVLLAICLVTLTSSIFLGTGVNLANWLMTIVELLNSYIPG